MQKTKTEHLYVEINPKICSGSPVISGTRTRIVDVAIEYEYLNHTPDEIINAHPTPKTRTNPRRIIILLRKQSRTRQQNQTRQIIHPETSPKLKTIAETRTAEEMKNQIIFL